MPIPTKKHGCYSDSLSYKHISLTIFKMHTALHVLATKYQVRIYFKNNNFEPGSGGKRL